jgi:hypothetical protein
LSTLAPINLKSKNTRFEEFQPQRTQRTQRKDCFAAFQFFLLLCSL